MGGMVGFIVWNTIVTEVSIGTGFWLPSQPNYHLAVSELVSVIPLIVVALLIGRR